MRWGRSRARPLALEADNSAAECCDEDVEDVAGRDVDHRMASAGRDVTAVSASRVGRETVNVAPRPGPGLAAAHRAAVRFDELADDRQADAEAAHAAHLFAFGLREAVEHVRQELPARCRAPCRCTIQADAAAVRARAQATPCRRRGVNFTRVRQQVPDDLPQPIRVARHPPR